MLFMKHKEAVAYRVCNSVRLEVLWRWVEADREPTTRCVPLSGLRTAQASTDFGTLEILETIPIDTNECLFCVYEGIEDRQRSERRNGSGKTMQGKRK